MKSLYIHSVANQWVSRNGTHPQGGRFRRRGVMLALVALAIGFPVSHSGSQSASEPDVNAPPFSITIYPISMAGTPQTDVAEVMGLFLEKMGVMDIHIAEQEFHPPQQSEMEDVVASLAEFALENPSETDFVLYGEFVGTPQTGVAEVRTVVLDKSGQLFWSDSQKPDDAEFKRVKPRNPMTCCVLMANRLRSRFDLPDYEGNDAPKGKMHQLWEAKSARPGAEELAAVKQRAATLKERAHDSSVTVFAIRIGKQVDEESARYLTESLNQEGLCKAVVADTAPQFHIGGNRNELRVLWDLARAFRDHIRENRPDSDYALYADYMLKPGGDKAHAVHFVVCDREGDWVIVDFQNEYQKHYKSVQPKTREDCGRVVVEAFEGYLR